eukprot:2776601-Prymnesium_polylepis.1
MTAAEPPFTILSASPGWHRLWGFSPADIAGKSTSILNGLGYDAAAGVRVRESYIATGSASHRCRNTSKSGQVFSHDLQLTQFVGSCLAVSTNVTPEPALTTAVATGKLSAESPPASGGALWPTEVGARFLQHEVRLTARPAARVRCLGWRALPTPASVLVHAVAAALLELRAEFIVHGSCFNCSSAKPLTPPRAAALFGGRASPSASDESSDSTEPDEPLIEPVVLFCVSVVASDTAGCHDVEVRRLRGSALLHG